MDLMDLVRRAGAAPGHLDCWDCNCHGFVDGVDWCQDPATWDPAMAARAAGASVSTADFVAERTRVNATAKRLLDSIDD